MIRNSRNSITVQILLNIYFICFKVISITTNTTFFNLSSNSENTLRRSILEPSSACFYDFPLLPRPYGHAKKKANKTLNLDRHYLHFLKLSYSRSAIPIIIGSFRCQIQLYQYFDIHQ